MKWYNIYSVQSYKIGKLNYIKKVNENTTQKVKKNKIRNIQICNLGIQGILQPYNPRNQGINSLIFSIKSWKLKS